MSMSQLFINSDGIPAKLPFALNTGFIPGNRTAGVTFLSNGRTYIGTDDNRPPSPPFASTPAYRTADWKVFDAFGGFEVELEITGGSLAFFDTSTGSLNTFTWYNLSSDRTWYIYNPNAGVWNTSGIVRIRNALTGVVYATNTFNFQGSS